MNSVRQPLIIPFKLDVLLSSLEEQLICWNSYSSIKKKVSIQLTVWSNLGFYWQILEYQNSVNNLEGKVAALTSEHSTLDTQYQALISEKDTIDKKMEGLLSKEKRLEKVIEQQTEELHILKRQQEDLHGRCVGGNSVSHLPDTSRMEFVEPRSDRVLEMYAYYRCMSFNTNIGDLRSLGTS